MSMPRLTQRNRNMYPFRVFSKNMPDGLNVTTGGSEGKLIAVHQLAVVVAVSPMMREITLISPLQTLAPIRLLLEPSTLSVCALTQPLPSFLQPPPSN
jgi:hypothetical protein